MAERALCIGINDYPGTSSDLGGCVNDARDWAALLEERGFEVELLLDRQATRSAMLRGIERLVQVTEPGDVLVITYSGHGSWLPDADDDEPDGRDEVLCPYDVRRAGPISDDRLHQLFDQLRSGTHAVLISDSCHSGSLTRSLQRARFLPPEAFLSGNALARAQVVEAVVQRRDRAPRESKVLLLSGAQDNQFSYDTEFDGRPNGAFTRFAIDMLATLPSTATYADWLRRIRQRLPAEQWPQTPGLYGSRAQENWQVFEATKTAGKGLEERLADAQPGERLDVSDVDRAELVAAVEELSRRKRRGGRPRDDDTDWGQYIHSHVDWWGPWPGVAGLVTIEFDHEAVLAYDKAITVPHLLAVGVPPLAAGIVAGVVWLLRDVDVGNGINLYVQLPSLVHWWVPR